MAFSNKSNLHKLRVIGTARDEKSINNAARSGFKPLVKEVIPSSQISQKYAVYQNKETSEIRVEHDFRSHTFYMEDEKYEEVIGFTGYYPYKFSSPFAAYLLPPDLQLGERVYLMDLIEDIVGSRWNQGDSYRLDSCEAIWNGNDFDIQFNQNDDVNIVMG